MTINDINLNMGHMDAIFVLTMEWSDCRLKWDSSGDKTSNDIIKSSLFSTRAKVDQVTHI